MERKKFTLEGNRKKVFEMNKKNLLDDWQECWVSPPESYTCETCGQDDPFCDKCEEDLGEGDAYCDGKGNHLCINCFKNKKAKE